MHLYLSFSFFFSSFFGKGLNSEPPRWSLHSSGRDNRPQKITPAFKNPSAAAAAAAIVLTRAVLTQGQLQEGRRLLQEGDGQGHLFPSVSQNLDLQGGGRGRGG